MNKKSKNFRDMKNAAFKYKGGPPSRIALVFGEFPKVGLKRTPRKPAASQTFLERPHFIRMLQKRVGKSTPGPG